MIIVGSFQSITFLAVFIGMVMVTLILFGVIQLVAMMIALLVIAFITELRGAYKAASQELSFKGGGGVNASGKDIGKCG